jgi:hypothetical protein
MTGSGSAITSSSRASFRPARAMSLATKVMIEGDQSWTCSHRRMVEEGLGIHRAEIDRAEVK